MYTSQCYEKLRIKQEGSEKFKDFSYCRLPGFFWKPCRVSIQFMSPVPGNSRTQERTLLSRCSMVIQPGDPQIECSSTSGQQLSSAGQPHCSTESSRAEPVPGQPLSKTQEQHKPSTQLELYQLVPTAGLYQVAFLKGTFWRGKLSPPVHQSCIFSEES